MNIRQYLSKVLDGMAKGLFASLIVGVILKQVGTYAENTLLMSIGQVAQYLMGPCIGAGIALALGAKPYTLLAAMGAGALGAGCVTLAEGGAFIKVGEPVGALVGAWGAIEVGRFLENKTKFDLFVVPGAMLLCGGLAGLLLSPVIAHTLTQVGIFINALTHLHPLPMGVLLAVVVGMILTLPISSAALCIAINISGLAAGAALAGCCAQMVGFAAISARDNKAGSVLAIGLGTSMLQVPNIIKNPYIWAPPTVAAAVCGPLATLYFHMSATSVGAGMGTSGLVGQMSTLSVMGTTALVPMLGLHFVLPAVVSLLVAAGMRRAGLIRDGDLAL